MFFCLSSGQCSPFPLLSCCFLFPPHIMHGFCALHIKLLGIFTIFLQIGMNPQLCSQSCCKKHLVSVSLNLQVPNTWLWWIWTCDWELCFAQKVAERERERKTLTTTEHEIHLSDAWHSDRWWKSHFMLQTCCTFRMYAFIDLFGCLF